MARPVLLLLSRLSKTTKKRVESGLKSASEDLDFRPLHRLPQTPRQQIGESHERFPVR